MAAARARPAHMAIVQASAAKCGLRCALQRPAAGCWCHAGAAGVPPRPARARSQAAAAAAAALRPAALLLRCSRQSSSALLCCLQLPRQPAGAARPLVPLGPTCSRALGAPAVVRALLWRGGALRTNAAGTNLGLGNQGRLPWRPRLACCRCPFESPDRAIATLQRHPTPGQKASRLQALPAAELDHAGHSRGCRRSQRAAGGALRRPRGGRRHVLHDRPGQGAGGAPPLLWAQAAGGDRAQAAPGGALGLLGSGPRSQACFCCGGAAAAAAAWRWPPAACRPAPAHARHHARPQVEGTCNGKHGFVLTVIQVLGTGRGLIREGSGSAVFNLRYSCICFKPFKGEVLDVVVTSVNKVRGCCLLQRWWWWCCCCCCCWRRRGCCAGRRADSHSSAAVVVRGGCGRRAAAHAAIRVRTAARGQGCQLPPPATRAVCSWPPPRRPRCAALCCASPTRLLATHPPTLALPHPRRWASSLRRARCRCLCPTT